jgi:rhodanese-related sulfurtransferase
MLLSLLPLDWTFPLLSVGIGFAFGFTLESSGFGDSRRLAAQFYFRESRVVKVMFTAIVTCMLLLLWASALGWMDLGGIWINPTYLASGILGGFVLGVGFIVGGYCPGTSIVSTATLKKDGMLFLLGVGAGSWVFSETAPAFRVWYDRAGSLGRVTLPEWLGLPAGVVAVLVVFMAVGMFVLFDALEQTIGRRSAAGGAVPAPAPRAAGFWRPAVRGGAFGLALYVVLAFALPAIGQPTLDDRLERMGPELEQELTGRGRHLDPTEALGLLHAHVQGELGRFRLLLLDVRDESDFNLFHLVDARNLSIDALRGEDGRSLTGPAWATSIKVVLSNEEARAEEAWRILRAQGVEHVYVLAGGINAWLDRFDPERPRVKGAAPEALDRVFDRALGDRYPASRPSLPTFLRLRGDRGDLPWKVQPVVKAPKATGGCG